MPVPPSGIKGEYSMKKISGNTIIGFLFAIAACIALYVTNTSIGANSAMGDPGPRLFPNAVCIAVLVLAVIIIIQSFLKVEHPFAGALSSPEKREGVFRMILIVADLALFLVLWQHLPFLAAGIIFMFLQCMIFREKLLFSVIYSVAVTGALYVVFVILLKVNLNIY